MKRQTGNYTKTPIALALAAMLSVLASGAQAQGNAATAELSEGQVTFLADETERNTVYTDVSLALKTIEETTRATRDINGMNNPEQGIGVLISLSQRGLENEIEIVTTDSSLVINSVGEYLQDSTDSSGGNTLTANISGSANNEDAGGNVVYLSQKGNSVFTLQIVGDNNQVMLSEFGGQLSVEAAIVNIYSSNNEVEIYRQGFAEGAADNLDLNISESSSGNVVVLGYDAFSTIVGEITSGSSYVTVVQDQGGQTSPEDSSLTDIGNKNNVTFTIDEAAGISGFFDLRQLGIGNQLTLVANGANNDIRIDQRNTAGGINKMTLNVDQDNSTFDISANGTNNVISIDQSNTADEGTVDGINKMTLNVDQDNSTIDINQAGPSTSVISLTGDGNAISVQNSRIGDSINPTVTNVSLTNTGSSGNSVTLRDYQRVGFADNDSSGVIVNGEGNILETQGNIATFKVSGNENEFSISNDMEQFSAGVNIEINGNENSSIEGLRHHGGSSDMVNYRIDGNNNTLQTAFFEIGGIVNVTIDNSAATAPQGNHVDIVAYGYSSFGLDITGDQNNYTFRGDSMLGSFGLVDSIISGDRNNQFFNLMSSNLGLSAFDITTNIMGNDNRQNFMKDIGANESSHLGSIKTSITGFGNSWDYTVGNSGFNHHILGDGFQGTVDYNTMSGGYKQSFSQLGSGSSEFTSQAGTVRISTQASM